MVSRDDLHIGTADLIYKVHARPALWDRSIPEYRDKEERDQAWTDITKEFVPSYDSLSATEQAFVVKVISKKWCNIRDAYVKSKKASIYQRDRATYKFSTQLAFLNPTYNVGEDESNYVKNENSSDADRQSQDENQSEAFENVYINFDTPDILATPPPKKKMKRDADNSVITVLSKLIDKEEDEDRSFFKSITPAVKSLKEDLKLEFRIKVMELLKQLKKKQKSIRNTSRREQSDSD